MASVSSDGRAFTLTDLQMMAAGNSPELRQAASDVEAARGNLIQARTYPNPTTGWEMTPSNDGSTAGAQGPFIDQVIKTGGKLKLASAAAEMDLRNAELALRRARSDLATRVRNAYYALLIAKETMRVSRSLAQFTDDVYSLHTGLLEAGNAASYEPMALRAQAYSVRLAYDQSLQTYLIAWKQLVAAMGMRQLPLSQVEGRIDALIPYFDYDTVLGYVLRNHTDVLAARNTLDKAKYQLKLAQVTPVPDIDVNVALLKDYVVEPKAMVATATIGFPLPIWDQNKGNILAAESGLVRATEESHRVEMNLTTLLTTNYTNYKTNLQALDFYRNHILPDQVRAYRGVLERRQLDPNAAFSDLFGAQQTLSGFVTTYLGVLSTLWTSSVNVADMLQSDDIFQLAQPQAVPALPDLGVLLPFPCCHPSAPGEPLIHYEAAAHVPQTTVAAAQPTTKPAQPTTSHAPATARSRGNQSRLARSSPARSSPARRRALTISQTPSPRVSRTLARRPRPRADQSRTPEITRRRPRVRSERRETASAPHLRDSYGQLSTQHRSRRVWRLPRHRTTSATEVGHESAKQNPRQPQQPRAIPLQFALAAETVATPWRDPSGAAALRTCRARRAVESGVGSAARFRVGTRRRLLCRRIRRASRLLSSPVCPIRPMSPHRSMLRPRRPTRALCPSVPTSIVIRASIPSACRSLAGWRTSKST